MTKYPNPKPRTMTAKSAGPYFVLLAAPVGDDVGEVVVDGDVFAAAEPSVLDAEVVAFVRVVASVAVDSALSVLLAEDEALVLVALSEVVDSWKTPPFVVEVACLEDVAGLEDAGFEEVFGFPSHSPFVLIDCQVPDMSP